MIGQDIRQYPSQDCSARKATPATVLSARELLSNLYAVSCSHDLYTSTIHDSRIMVHQIPISNTQLSNMTPTLSPGYPDLTKLMGAYSGMSIYLRFADLSARDLLVHQAEILQLEQELDAYDQKTPCGRTSLLKPLGEQITTIEEERWGVQMRLRAKLKDYSMFRCGVIRLNAKSDRI